MGKRRDRASPYNTSLSMPPPPRACGAKKPWRLGPFRRGQWLPLDPPCGSVIEYNVCIVCSVFYLLRYPNFFVQRERWRIDFLCILGKGFILFGYVGAYFCCFQEFSSMYFSFAPLFCLFFSDLSQNRLTYLPADVFKKLRNIKIL